MMTVIEVLAQKLTQRFHDLAPPTIAFAEVSLDLDEQRLLEVCLALRDEADFKFDLLLDVCVVDYQDYGISEWQTEGSTSTGFERGVDKKRYTIPGCELGFQPSARFSVVYHLLSIAHNHRLRLRVFIDGDPPLIASVNSIWPAANWYEREAFDLFGVLFVGHPDLRRLLTDYGFVGHPFRKDFPLSGHVEVRYDAKEERVVYQPVSITPRTLVAKTIRKTAQLPSSKLNEA